MEATDPADVEPRLSYAVHGSIGGGGTRHMKATVPLLKSGEKIFNGRQTYQPNEISLFPSFLLVHGDHGWGQQKPLNMGVSDIWRGRQRGPAVRSAAGRAPPRAARGPVPALF